MEEFQGRKKVVKKSRFSDEAKITSDRLKKIPKKVNDINKFPRGLKRGAVPVTGENAESVFRGFLKEHKSTFKVKPDDLKVISVKNIKNRWYVKYGQYYKGIPVHKATVGLDSLENGKVVSYAANYHPRIKVSTEPQIELDRAVDTAKKTYQDTDPNKLEARESMLVIYPEKQERKMVYHLAWKFLITAEQPDPEIEKYFFVDALDGKILSAKMSRPDAGVSGKVQAEIYPENPTDAVTTMPLRHNYVEIEGAGTATTNHSGDYSRTVPGGWSPPKDATFTLDGPYARVVANNSDEYTETRNCNTSSPCNHTWSAADRDHINIFYHMNLYHDWLESELGYSWRNNWDGSNRFQARVNDPRNNAWAGNPMLFGTNNYARSSDVIYHECTHNILVDIYGDYIGWPDDDIEGYAMDEGFADHFSNAFTNDSIHGEGCSAAPRNHDNNRKYQGKAAYNLEGHTGGMTIGGAAWDFRQRLIAAHGANGARIADRLMLEAHQILSTYPAEYFFSDPHESNLLTALYKAADTNSDLTDRRVPYFEDIQAAFHNHDLLQAVLEKGDSYDFSANLIGSFTGGDLYYSSSGKFYANNVGQRGVTDLGNIGDVDLSGVAIPNSGYTRFGVTPVVGHTYVAHAQHGENGGNIVFRVTDLAANKSTVTIKYFYNVRPYQYVANTNSREIHHMSCIWVSRMSNWNKSYYSDLWELEYLIKSFGYNGCYYCMHRYDRDTHSAGQVTANLNSDLD